MKRKRPYRVKYTCECGVKVWGKYDLKLRCMNCNTTLPMEPDNDIKPYDWKVSKRPIPSFDKVMQRIILINKNKGKEETKIILQNILVSMHLTKLSELKNDAILREIFWNKINKIAI